MIHGCKNICEHVCTCVCGDFVWLCSSPDPKLSPNIDNINSMFGYIPKISAIGCSLRTNSSKTFYDTNLFPRNLVLPAEENVNKLYLCLNK